MFSNTKFLIALAATALLAACASKPVNMPAISENASASAEIQKTEQMINEARQQQVDVLSPKNFTQAEKHLAKAKVMQEKEKPNAKIIEELSYAQGFLADAKGKSEISALSMKDITTAREGALQARASEILPKEWRGAEKDLESVTKKIEKGNLSKADKEGSEIIAKYRELEIKSVEKAHLGVAAANIEKAKKDKADKKAPKTWGLAVMKYDNATKIIASNPKNTEAIRAAATDATKESVRLNDILGKVNAGNSEDLVLTAERQQRQIGTLRKGASQTASELAMTEEELASAARQNQALAAKQSELQKSQDALKTAATLREQLKPTEAEVFVDQNKVKVRLKALRFPSNQSALGPKNQAFLNKVESALQGINVSRVTVEGHTDATGDADKNAVLSEKRAQSVEQYLTAKGGLKSDQVQAVGLGSEQPISDNNTARGRAENRRIDLVIETE
ncbi:hypothetical protein AZI86_00100 [Bdellovibrio bacteriovorus]|uniref:OmpA-like domain-containing protein n=1 Tax=Bdellovibrio bacteriovorus TaxID=959 RepID=A0A150WMI2_BDEBC|nr:OmpA family protein [Bdellovibrio bacteriovorus]KYG65517.1 hypothetical protein AZI86_00100 [Bdellovibrio bacteriovorus]